MKSRSKVWDKADKKKVLFLCFHNSARSQMAEGLLRDMYGDQYEVRSAGIEASKVDPRALKVMREIGIDISGQRSKGMDEHQGTLFDLAATVCNKAKVGPVCGANIWAPPYATPKGNPQKFQVAAATGLEEEQLAVFRQTRDEIKDWIEETFR